MKDKKNKFTKKRTLYVKLVVPAIVLAIVGCVVVSTSLKSGIENVMLKQNRDKLEKAIPVILENFQTEKTEFLNKVNFVYTNYTNQSVESLQIDKMINAYEWYGVVVLDNNGKAIKKYGNSSTTLSNIEKDVVAKCKTTVSPVEVAVTNNEILYVAAAKIGNNIILCEKELSKISVLEKYAGLLDCVITFFIDDIRVETTIKDANGKYLTGTNLNNDTIYNEVYTNRNIYKGNNVINGEKYVTVYIPYDNDEGTKVMLFMGVSIKSIDEATNRITSTVLPIVIVVLLIILLVIMLIVVISIMKPLKGTVKAFEGLNGNSGIADLTLRVAFKENDEIGAMSNAINKFINSQQSLLTDVKEASDSLRSVGESLASSSQQSASAITEIMANIESVNRSIVKQGQALDEVRDVLKHSIEGIGNFDRLIENQSAGIVESSAAIEQMIGNISSVTNSVGKMTEEYQQLMSITEEEKNRQNMVAKQIDEMSSQSQNLSDANNVISQIASQTNLLAMNAAIEAAHAGDAGKGFSVVADEIRKLAEDSSKQSKAISQELSNITKIITEVVNNSSKSIKGFEQISEKVGSTEVLVNQINGAMTEQEEASKQVLIALKNVTDSTAEVQTTSKEVLAGIQNVSNATDNLGIIADTVVGSMSEMTSGVTEINRSAQDVSEMANTTKNSIEIMDEVVNKFKLE